MTDDERDEATEEPAETPPDDDEVREIRAGDAGHGGDR